MLFFEFSNNAIAKDFQVMWIFLEEKSKDEKELDKQLHKVLPCKINFQDASGEKKPFLA